MLASMRFGSLLTALGLGVLSSLAVPGCLGDAEHTGPSAGGALGGGGGVAVAGASPVAPGGYGGDASVPMGGSQTGTGGAKDPSALPLVVTAAGQPCSITLTRAETSSRIGTVGLIEFQSTWRSAEAATIEFGRHTTYGMTAPVDLAAQGAKAVLLGMINGATYHYRIVLRSGGTTCKSRDLTLVTEAMPTGTSIGPGIVSAGSSVAPAASGYIIGGNYNGSWVFILNRAGELVWYFETSITNISSVRLAPDARHVYARTLNVGRSPLNGRIVKIAIDGSSEEVISLTSSHHDFAFGPDGSIVYLRKSLGNDCDSVFLHWLEDEDDSEDELIADLDPVFTVDGTNMMLGNETCHANSVHYQADGGYTVSDLVHNAYVKLDELGGVEWILGGGVDSTFAGDGALWARQHGHQLLAPDRLLFFNNQTAKEKRSRALEVTLDFVAGAATYAPFEYSVEGLSSQVLGDVRRLPGGNTLVTYSVGAGLLHEVDPYGTLVRQVDLPGGPCGYTDFRESLYAAPEPNAEPDAE